MRYVIPGCLAGCPTAPALVVIHLSSPSNSEKGDTIVSRRYGHVIKVQTDHEQGTPLHFTWRSVCYRVRAVWAMWHLRDRWWAGGEAGMPPASDRRYYRVLCTKGMLCDLYYDAANDTWVLDRVHD